MDNTGGSDVDILFFDASRGSGTRVSDLAVAAGDHVATMVRRTNVSGVQASLTSSTPQLSKGLPNAI
jgi:hypothetical protein